jgi:hypothetical protein
VKEIKSFNASETKIQESIASLDALRIILHDSMENLVGLVMTICLVRFLSSRRYRARAGFSTSLSYMMANACAPIIISLNYQRARNQERSASCISHLQPRDESLEVPDAGPRSSSPFPVILVFHILATACVWFMDAQAKQHEKNVLAVERLRADLSASGAPGQKSGAKGAKQKSQARATTSKPSPTNANSKNKNA